MGTWYNAPWLQGGDNQGEGYVPLPYQTVVTGLNAHQSPARKVILAGDHGRYASVGMV